MAGSGRGPATDQLAHWLALHHAPRLGARRKIQLLESFGSIEAVFAAGKDPLARALGERADGLEALLSGPDATLLATTQQWLDDARNFVVTWADPDYPALLRQIDDPPLLLYGIGARAVLASAQLAIVGSRNPSPGGRDNARAFAAHLAQAGLTITSGLALGIDGAAHEGALEAGGKTIAVTGTGLDRVYPPRHRELAHRICDNGALLSEFALGTPPRAENFPIRNRLISGMSLGVLVVEAALKSGSLISARLATEQGREVFAIPGSIHSPLARGCHALIRQGAKLVETANDVLEELGPLARLVTAASASDRTHTDAMLTDSERALLACLGHDPVDIDTLATRSGLTPQAVSSMLLSLELHGQVAALPGGRYQRSR
jgi:DNA processing protein